jgi:hypothetical protein
MGIDDSGKYQNRYVFSSNIICGKCGGIFRRQKIYIGKPYEKIQWCCSQHIEDKSKCSLKGIREDVIKWAFTVMWNKLTSNYTDILIPLLESLKSLRIDEQQEQEISECNNRIMELTEQSHILSSVVAKGYIDSAVFIERQNTLTLELAAAKRTDFDTKEIDKLNSEINDSLISINNKLEYKDLEEIYTIVMEKISLKQDNSVFNVVINRKYAKKENGERKVKGKKQDGLEDEENDIDTNTDMLSSFYVSDIDMIRQKIQSGDWEPNFLILASHGIGNCYLWEPISDNGFHTKITGYTQAADFILQL